MRVGSKAIAALCVLGVAASGWTADRGLAGRRYVENEVIVKFRPGVIVENVHAMAGMTVPGAFVVKSMVLPSRAGAVQLGLMRAPRGKASVEELVAQFSASPDVEYAEPNYVASVPGEKATAATVEPWPSRTFASPVGATSGREISGEDLVAMSVYPSDSYSQWGFGAVDADIIWTSTTASPLVAVIDSGVDYTHPDLVGKIVKGYNFVEGTADPMDDNGHGTHVSGVIAARTNNKVGISGISNGKVLAIKALDFSGYGTYFEIAQALYYAASNSAVKVINMSLGGPTDSTTLRDAVGYAVVTKGKLLVVSAGNSNSSVPSYPAGYSVAPAFLNRVLAVAASGITVTGSTDGNVYSLNSCKATYSNYGTWVNITAPGTSVVSTMPTKPNWSWIYNYGTMSGTSMAAPHVAAVAARVWSVNSLFTNVQIAERLTGGGTSPQPAYGVYTGSYDVDGDGTIELAMCWDPAWVQQGGTAGRTLPSLTQANAAMGMQRAEVFVYVYDATNGNALPSGTLLQAYQGTALKGQTTMTSLGQMLVYVGNLPWSVTPYTLKVKKAGYTAGAQAFGTANLGPGSNSLLYGTDLQLPRLSANRTFVTTWPTWGFDVDQHLLLPPDKPFDVGTDFNSTKTRITSSGDYGSGTLAAFPYARYMADSWFARYASHETTVVKTLYPTAFGPYRLFNRDYRSGFDLTYGQLHSFGYSPRGPVTRLWQGGVIKATVSADTASIQSSPACTFNGGAAVCDKWFVGTLNSAGVFTPVNTIGDGVNGAVVPYGGANLRAGTSAP